MPDDLDFDPSLVRTRTIADALPSGDRPYGVDPATWDQRNRAGAELAALFDRNDGPVEQWPEGQRQRHANLSRALEKAALAVDAQRHAALMAAAQRTSGEAIDNTAAGYGGQAPAQTRNRDPWADAPHRAGMDPGQLRDRAMVVLEHYRNRDVLTPEAADRADHVLRHADPTGDTAAYLTAVGDPNYATAFGKLLADPIMGHNRFSAAEVEAVRRVSVIQGQQRAMNEATGPAGAFAIPFTLDPSIILTSAGALNPVRTVASVDTIGTREWKGVSSDGVVAGYVGEATQATDASPTLAQPAIRTQQGRAFIKASIELTQDWARIQAEMAKLIDDARQVLDASEFLTGDGNNRPVGILAIGTTGSLSTSQRVLTAATNDYAVGDPWLLKAAIPARFQPNSTFAAAPGIWDTTYRFVGGNSTEPLQMPSRGGDMMGRPKIEWSTMVTFETTGSRVMVGGDFRTGFKIVDRLGMTIEVIPHLFTNNMPSGERGFYGYWRTGSAVVAPNALRYLEVK
jgi:HK97 family phage major capsid protein